MNKNFTNQRQIKKAMQCMVFSILAASTLNPQLAQAKSANSFQVSQQQESIVVKGTVRDAKDGLPLPGVTISTAQGQVIAATNVDGAFSVQVKRGTVLSFNMIGY